jgi:hypothetical protein
MANAQTTEIDVSGRPDKQKGPLTSPVSGPPRVGVTGLEPATSWSRSSPLSPPFSVETLLTSTSYIDNPSLASAGVHSRKTLRKCGFSALLRKECGRHLVVVGQEPAQEKWAGTAKPLPCVAGLRLHLLGAVASRAGRQNAVTGTAVPVGGTPCRGYRGRGGQAFNPNAVSPRRRRLPPAVSTPGFPGRGC